MLTCMGIGQDAAEIRGYKQEVMARRGAVSQAWQVNSGGHCCGCWVMQWCDLSGKVELDTLSGG